MDTKRTDKYKTFHKFTRETFIRDIKMFTQVYDELGSKICGRKHNINISELDRISDEKLIDVHMYYWRNL